MHDLFEKRHAPTVVTIDGLMHDVALDDARGGTLVSHDRGDSVPAAVKNLRSAVAGVILCGLLAGASNASADPLTRAAVERALGGYEHDADLATVRAWGAEGATLLIEVSRDNGLVVATRARALHALRAYGSDLRVRDHLRAMAATPTQDLFLLRASLDALIEGFDDVSEARRYLSDARVDVRDGAVWSLAASTNPAARVALRERLQVETDAGVRATITEALARPVPAPAPATAFAPRLTSPAVTTPTRAPRTRRARSR
jgi:hypothetical protein